MKSSSQTPVAATPKTAFDAAPTSAAQNKKSPRLWVWVWLAFALQITAWIFWIKIASRHRVEEVPLATAPTAPTHGPPAAQSGAREGTENLNRDVSPTSDTRK
ncbi:hypothetical protein AXK11_03825 [Cephaloticoccus primus]|uniref:Uncharacterized protein n=1 Tax=Cephaloticoccus primus TaxID=1548207 RepID=A0A139SQ56_9BACT|nr:hypothetical protein [Cephaloticoccus primus]KXU36667.1 hypothetical protein AXK11_03825 [Cephaloticoccus primus]